jgi:hypothetical protein
VAVKPVIANARWGETAAGVVGPNDTAPSSGQRDTGYATNAIAVSSFQNRIWRELYLWCKYLSDGDLDGPISIDGDLSVIGEVSCTSAEVSGNLDVAGVITGGRGSRRRHFPVGIGRQLVGAGGTQATGSFTNGATSDTFEIPLVLEQGDRVTKIECVVDPAATGVITMDFIRVDDGTQTNINRGQAVSSGGAIQTLTLTPTSGSETVPAPGVNNFQYVMRFSFTLATGHQVRGVYVTTDRAA